MEYMYAVMLLNSAKADVNEANIKKVLEAAGVKSDEAKIKSVVASLDGVDIEKVIEESASVAAAPVAAASSGAAAPKVEEKKVEKAPEVDASAGLGSLF
jgi:large subunit ribosomal protein L12